MSEQSVLCEAAHLVALHGLAENQHGSVDDPDGWHALCVVSVGGLHLLEEHDAAYNLLRAVGAARHVVWLHVHIDGQRHVIGAATLDKTAAMMRAWESMIAGGIDPHSESGSIHREPPSDGDPPTGGRP